MGGISDRNYLRPSYEDNSVGDPISILQCDLYCSCSFHTRLWQYHISKKNGNVLQTFPLKISLKRYLAGLPWWCSCWEFTCQCRGHGFDPWSGKIPHAAEQQSLMRYNYWPCALESTSHNYWARMLQLLKPAHLEPVIHKRSHRSEKPTHHNKE